MTRENMERLVTEFAAPKEDRCLTSLLVSGYLSLFGKGSALIVAQADREEG